VIGPKALSALYKVRIVKVYKSIALEILVLAPFDQALIAVGLDV
jgi:hypothetical protein